MLKLMDSLKALLIFRYLEMDVTKSIVFNLQNSNLVEHPVIVMYVIKIMPLILFKVRFLAMIDFTKFSHIKFDFSRE